MDDDMDPKVTDDTDADGAAGANEDSVDVDGIEIMPGVARPDEDEAAPAADGAEADPT